MLEHPIDTVKSLSGLISDIYNDPALLKRISKEKLSEWEDQLKIFETGNDYQRGKTNGELIVDVLATFSGVGLDEKLASEVPKMAKLEKIFSADEIVVRPTKVIEGSDKAEVKIFEKNSDHIFRDEEGHFKNDTLENRNLLLKTASDKANYLGTDEFGNEWYGKVTDDGKQIWAQVRNGEIRNGELNETPKSFDSETSLSNPE